MLPMSPLPTEDCERILLTKEDLDRLTTRLAAEIEDTYRHSPRQLVLVVILKGAMPFAADLMRKISLPVQLECMRVSSYGNGSRSSGDIRILLDLGGDDLSNTDLLIVEDIVDSGKTLKALTELLLKRSPGSLRTCTLLDKPSRRETDFEPDFCGEQIPDEFVVGYGLDYAERYRQLPFVGILKKSIYSETL